MATIKPIDYGALKVTFPANLPRNEKELICMLLAGRLKDLWNGKLICAQLAVDDLIKDLTGVSALKGLRDQLTKLKGRLNGFKQASGYDKILSGVNQALGQISNVFSLGGLCPSPVSVPKIPDVLATLNQNLFGQANNILNALAQASNPKVCLGNGPKGFGLDWSKVTGDLKVLKNTIDQFKKNPAGLNTTMQAFESNIKNQAKRLNSELKRLEKNLTDPLGINEKKNTVGSVKRVKAISDGFPVKDKRGILYKNPSQLLVTGEIEHVLSRVDPLYETPIKYVTVPIIDYCGNITGYERKTIVGDPEFIGYDTYFTELNVPTPTTLPVPTYKEFDYVFVEESGQVKVYDTNAQVVNTINLQRGRHYRMGVELTTLAVGIYNSNTQWAAGITLTKEPAFGIGFETVTDTISLSKDIVEMDWAVTIENPTTPSNLTWKASNGQTGNIIIGGPTALPEEDKTYDTSMAVKKAWLNSIHSSQTSPAGGAVVFESRYKKRKYNVVTKITRENGSTTNHTSTVSYARGLKVLLDKENFLLDEPFEGGKIVLLSQKLPSNKYFVIKKFINDNAGVELNQISCYITDGDPANIADPQTIEPLAAVQFDEPLLLLNDVRLPYTDNNNYKLSFGSNGKLNGVEQTSVKIVTNSNKKYLAVHCGQELKPPSQMSTNSFIYSTYIEIDPNDPLREYITVNPIENKTVLQFKGEGNFFISCEITYIGEDTLPSITTQVKSSPTGPYLLATSFTVPEYTFNQNKYQSPFRPVKINGATPPYVYSVDPPLPPGLIFDVDTGTIRGTPEKQQDRIKYTVSIDEEDTNLYNKEFYIRVIEPGSLLLQGTALGNGSAGSNVSSGVAASTSFTVGGGYVSGWKPTADLIQGRDYYYSSLWTDQPSYRDLRTETPTSVVRQPIVSGNGVVYNWLVQGKTFQTGIIYNRELVAPRLWKYDLLPRDQRFLLINEYSNLFNPPLEFLISGSGPNEPAYTESTFFNNFLASKNIGPSTGETFTSTHGDVYTWNGSAWTLTTPWVRPT